MSSALRANLLARVQAARADLLTAVEGLSNDQMLTPSLDGWSARDHLAHIAAWDELRYYEVMRVVRGQPALYHDLRDDHEVQDVNRAFVYFRRNLNPEEILREMEFSRGRVLELLEKVPEDRLAEAAEGRMRIRRAADHDMDHARQIRAWRERERI
jgi:hypothetical protein